MERSREGEEEEEGRWEEEGPALAVAPPPVPPPPPSGNKASSQKATRLPARRQQGFQHDAARVTHTYTLYTHTLLLLLSTSN